MGFVTGLATLSGFGFLSYYLARLALWVYRAFLYKSGSVNKYLGTGKWAVITGCTGGIGEGFAKELAKRKTNLILVSRNESKLQAQAKALEDKHKIKTKIVVMDFKSRDLDYTALEKACESAKNVTVLVNNVGINTYLPDNLEDHSQEDIDDMIYVNINGTVNVTRSVLKTMKQGKGLIFNLSSYTSQFPTPMMSIYSGTKSFMDAMGIAMSAENKNIKVHSLTPMYVASAMTHIRKPNLQACSGQRLAADALNAIGAPFLSASFSPYFFHDVMTTVIGLLPESMAHSQMLGKMKYVRKRLIHKRDNPRPKKD